VALEIFGRAKNITDIILKAGADVNIVGLKGTVLLVASERGFHCEICLDFDLCSACKAALDEDPSTLGNRSLHRISHLLLEFQHSEHLGQE